MPRHVFYSFHYELDHWRAQMIRNMGMVDGNKSAHPNEWEEVKRGGDAGIRRWIDDQMYGRSCVVVLIGEETAGRKWINYEIEKAWNEKKGLLGIHVHNLKNNDGAQALRGNSPFQNFNVDGRPLTSIVPSHMPPFSDSQMVYAHIKGHLEGWIEDAINIRNRYS